MNAANVGRRTLHFQCSIECIWRDFSFSLTVTCSGIHYFIRISVMAKLETMAKFMESDGLEIILHERNLARILAIVPICFVIKFDF